MSEPRPSVVLPPPGDPGPPLGAGAARPYHHGNLRAALLAHAEEALAEGGVPALSLRDLARRAGVSHAAPRRHFPDKQALLDALARDGFERLGAAMRAARDGAPPGFEARLAAVAAAYVRFATEHAALLELMYAGKHRPDATDELREAADRAFAAPLGLVAEAQATGEVVPGDPARVALVTWAAVHGLASMANAGLLGATAPGDAVPAAVERLVLGLRPR
jgi:AcrR family transcriptional regulator